MKHVKENLYLGIIVVLTISLMYSCKDAVNKTQNETEEATIITKEKVAYDVSNPKSLVMAAAEACGGYDMLKSLKDVSYEYHYVAPDGKKNISQERYIFANEASWADYSVLEINAPAGLKGNLVQFYDGTSTKVYDNGKPVTDPETIGGGQFLRQANYMWFTMVFKLSDPGIIYKYLGQEEMEGTTYDKVHITYDQKITGKEENDIYIVHINPETQMMDSFYFSLPAFGVLEPVLHAQLTYTDIDGIKVITHRVMTGPSPDGKGRAPLVDQQLKDIKFNNGFTTEDLAKAF